MLLLYVLPRAVWTWISNGPPPYFEYPVRRWAHLSALWFVYVPLSRIRANGGVWALFFPTQSNSFRHAQIKAIQKGNALVKTRLERRDDLRKLICHAEVEETRLLREAADAPASSQGSGDPIDCFRRMAEHHRVFKQYLTELEDQIEEIQKMAKRQACFEITGYQGVGDWCQEILSAYGTVITSVSTVCALGAGLTYTTIFTAIRGDVTYMQWAFSFFITGLVIVIFIQGILQWGATLPQYPFITVGIWETVVALGVFSAIALVVSAFCLLLLSVYRFQPLDKDTIQLSGSSKTSVVIAFTAVGVSLGIIIMVFVLFVVVHGINTFLWERSMERARSRRKLLDDYMYMCEV